MTTTRPIADIFSPYESELKNWPLKYPIEGDPVASYNVVSRTDEKRNYTGVWECTPGKFRVEYDWDETIYVLEGRVTIEEVGGETKEFKTGDVVHFHNGLRAVWTVHETIRKIYTLFLPEPSDL